MREKRLIGDDQVALGHQRTADPPGDGRLDLGPFHIQRGRFHGRLPDLSAAAVMSRVLLSCWRSFQGDGVFFVEGTVALIKGLLILQFGCCSATAAFACSSAAS